VRQQWFGGSKHAPPPKRQSAAATWWIETSSDSAFSQITFVLVVLRIVNRTHWSDASLCNNEPVTQRTQHTQRTQRYATSSLIALFLESVKSTASRKRCNSAEFVFDASLRSRKSTLCRVTTVTFRGYIVFVYAAQANSAWPFLRVVGVMSTGVA